MIYKIVILLLLFVVLALVIYGQSSDPSSETNQLLNRKLYATKSGLKLKIRYTVYNNVLYGYVDYVRTGTFSFVIDNILAIIGALGTLSGLIVSISSIKKLRNVKSKK